VCVGDTHLQGLHQGLHCARQRRFGAQQGQPLPCRQGASSRHVEERERSSRSWLRNTPHEATRLSVEASNSPGYDSFSLLLSTVGISSPVSVARHVQGRDAERRGLGDVGLGLDRHLGGYTGKHHPQRSIILINPSSSSIPLPHQSTILIDRSSSSNLGTASERCGRGIKQRGLEH